MGARSEGVGGEWPAFSPHSRLVGEREGAGGWGGGTAAVPPRLLRPLSALGPPAEAEGAADQRPMAADGAGGAHPEVGPAPPLLDLFLPLLRPLAPPVQPHH